MKWYALALMTVATPAFAQTATDEGTYEDIVVEGIKSPYRLTPTQLREAVDAYTAERAKLAPDAPLRFQVFRYRLDPALAGVRFRLVTDRGEAIPIDVNADGQFALPPVDFAKQGYALQANRKAGAVRVRPLILSPGSTDADSRLGDLRLSCAVSWAMMRQNVSVAIRAVVGMAGGLCSSSRIGVYYTTERPITSGRVVANAKDTPISVRPGGNAFRYPGYIKSLPNDARVVLVYK